MASSNFDELTRALASSKSRRQTIKAIVASTLGGALAFGGLGTALARPQATPLGGPCTANGDCDSYTCDKHGGPGGKGICICRSSGTACSNDFECCKKACYMQKGVGHCA